MSSVDSIQRKCSRSHTKRWGTTRRGGELSTLLLLLLMLLLLLLLLLPLVGVVVVVVVLSVGEVPLGSAKAPAT